MLEIVPTYELYGEKSDEKPDFWLHCETIFSRSSLHQFEIKLHRHDNFYQFLYIESGHGSVFLENEALEFTGPCAILMPPDFSHGFAFSRDIVGHITTILQSEMPVLQDGRSSADWLNKPQLVPMHNASSHIQDYLAATIRLIYEEFSARNHLRNHMLEIHLTSALLMVGRHAVKVHSERTGFVISQNGRRMEQLLELIRRHFREHLPVGFYAQALHLSPIHLNRVSREITGQTVQELLSAQLIEAAKRELVAMPHSVQTISYNLGFSDPAYFSRFFQRETGQTPKQYRLSKHKRLSEQAAEV
ncbi:helix-turn-helix domain-containing protein [Paenochrobactrum sp. BZR 588]|uniref:helix-turn-helix domain-containing protein n=1 Tax=unclassified Paenochrobactrum TaxID=2639760 RepID=UPI0038519CE8